MTVPHALIRPAVASLSIPALFERLRAVNAHYGAFGGMDRSSGKEYALDMAAKTNVVESKAIEELIATQQATCLAGVASQLLVAIHLFDIANSFEGPDAKRAGKIADDAMGRAYTTIAAMAGLDPVANCEPYLWGDHVALFLAEFRALEAAGLAARPKGEAGFSPVEADPMTVAAREYLDASALYAAAIDKDVEDGSRLHSRFIAACDAVIASPPTTSLAGALLAAEVIASNDAFICSISEGAFQSMHGWLRSQAATALAEPTTRLLIDDALDPMVEAKATWRAGRNRIESGAVGRDMTDDEADQLGNLDAAAANAEAPRSLAGIVAAADLLLDMQRSLDPIERALVGRVRDGAAAMMRGQPEAEIVRVTKKRDAAKKAGATSKRGAA